MIRIYDLSEKNKNDDDEEEEIFSAEEDLLWYTTSEWTREVNEQQKWIWYAITLSVRHHFVGTPSLRQLLLSPTGNSHSRKREPKQTDNYAANLGFFDPNYNSKSMTTSVMSGTWLYLSRDNKWGYGICQ